MEQTAEQTLLSSPTAPSSKCAPSSPSKASIRHPLLRGGPVPMTSPKRPPLTRGGVVPEAKPAPKVVRARDSPIPEDDAQPQPLPALCIPTEHGEIATFLCEFMEQHPSVKATVNRLVTFMGLQMAYSEGGCQSEEIAAALVKARVPVKVGTPPLSPEVTPRVPHEFPAKYIPTPSGLRRQVVLEQEKVKVSAACARQILDKKWDVRYSETSPRTLTPLEAQAVDIVRAFFRTAPRTGDHTAASSPSSSSSSATVTPLNSAASPSVPHSPSTLDHHAADVLSCELTEDELLAALEEVAELIPVGLNLPVSPLVPEDEESPYMSPSPSPCPDAWSLGAMVRAMSAAEASRLPPPPAAELVVPQALEFHEDDKVVVAHIEGAADLPTQDELPTSPKFSVATETSVDNEAPRTSLRAQAIARLITGTSVRQEAKAAMRQTAFIGLGIVGIGLGVATTSFPSCSDLASASVEPALSPDLPTAATFAPVPTSTGLNVVTSVGLSSLAIFSHGGSGAAMNHGGNVHIGATNSAHAALRRRIPFRSLSPELCSSNFTPTPADLDGVDEGVAHQPEKPRNTGTLSGIVEMHHSTRRGRGLAGLLTLMARSLMGSWFIV